MVADPLPQEPTQKNPAVETIKVTPSLQNPDPTRYGDWEKGGKCVDF